MIHRILQKELESAYGRRKVITILGPRQVGKSTLLSELATAGTKVRILNCDNEDDRRLLIDKTSTELKTLVEPHDFFLIDEAQRVKNIGLTLKKIGDLHLDTHVIVTGSSSFDLADEINEQLEQKLDERLALAGIEVVEARINYLAYAPEIAAVMLRRQQASAIITAREKIVEGAVSMVKMALDKLSNEDIVELDDDKKAAMVSNLLVVLCGDDSAQPVVNTGTLNH